MDAKMQTFILRTLRVGRYYLSQTLSRPHQWLVLASGSLVPTKEHCAGTAANHEEMYRRARQRLRQK
jgi:hypothetical protein